MAFRAHQRVCFGDIDNAGIVYYPRFLHYFHVALEDFFHAELGIDYSTVIGHYGLGFPTVHLEADFQRPLRFGDQIEVEVRVMDVGRTSITWGYTAYKGETVIVQGHNVTVSMHLATFTKTEVPAWLRRLLLDYRERCRSAEQVP